MDKSLEIPYPSGPNMRLLVKFKPTQKHQTETSVRTVEAAGTRVRSAARAVAAPHSSRHD